MVRERPWASRYQPGDSPAGSRPWTSRIAPSSACSFPSGTRGVWPCRTTTVAGRAPTALSSASGLVASTPRTPRTAPTTSRSTSTNRPCQSQYDVATPYASASSTSARSIPARYPGGCATGGGLGKDGGMTSATETPVVRLRGAGESANARKTSAGYRGCDASSQHVPAMPSSQREIRTPFEAETTNQIKGFGGLVPHTRNSRMNPPVHLPILCPIVLGESRANLGLYDRTV